MPYSAGWFTTIINLFILASEFLLPGPSCADRTMMLNIGFENIKCIKSVTTMYLVIFEWLFTCLGAK